MKRESKRNQLPIWRSPLPDMTAQEKRKFLANLGKGFETTGEVTLSIALTEDILSSEGKKKFESKNMKNIEQVNVSTIKDDKLILPSQLGGAKTKDNVFEAMDSKIEESRRISNKIQNDFDELNIPLPREPIEVEPLFETETTERVIEREIPESTNKDKLGSSIEFKSKSNKSTKSNRTRAMQTLKHAERTIHGYTHQTERKNRSARTNGINWDKVNEYIREEDF